VGQAKQAVTFLVLGASLFLRGSLGGLLRFGEDFLLGSFKKVPFCHKAIVLVRDLLRLGRDSFLDGSRLFLIKIGTVIHLGIVGMGHAVEGNGLLIQPNILIHIGIGKALGRLGSLPNSLLRQMDAARGREHILLKYQLLRGQGQGRLVLCIDSFRPVLREKDLLGLQGIMILLIHDGFLLNG
jgi:hypothetical protein